MNKEFAGKVNGGWVESSIRFAPFWKNRPKWRNGLYSRQLQLYAQLGMGGRSVSYVKPDMVDTAAVPHSGMDMTISVIKKPGKQGARTQT